LFAIFGGLAALLVVLTALSPRASILASETSDVAPVMTSVVPEPATLLFFGAAATALFRRRWTHALR